MPDVVLTGLPRSGSTLTCNLLNRCADTVALHEPIPMMELIQANRGSVMIDAVGRFFEDERDSLLTRRRATSKRVDGQVPDNTFGESRGNDDLRRSLASHGEVSFEGKDLSPDFTLAIKHNSGFVAMLEGLTTRFACYGIVRHPLAVLSSWNSVKLPVQQGHVPVGEQIDGHLRGALARIHDRTERQFYILEWFFERFARLLPPTSILRYEDLIASRGRALEKITWRACQLDEPLASRNKNAAYNPVHQLDLGERLLGRGGSFWNFYTKDSVEEMLLLLRQASKT